jgi:hypothetical protein
VLVGLFAPGCAEPGEAVAPSAIEYRWGADGPYARLASPLAREPPGRGTARELTLRFVLPTLPEEDPALSVGVSTGLVRSEVDGRALSPHPAEWPLFPLRATDAEKTATLVFRTDRPIVPGALRVGSQRAMVIAALRRDLLQFGIGLTLAFGGVVLLFGSVARGATRENRWLGAFSLAQGAALVVQAQAFFLLVWPRDDARQVIHDLLLFVERPSFELFVVAAFGDTRWRAISRAAVATLVLLPVVLALHAGGVVSLVSSRKIIPLTVLVMSPFVFSRIIAAARRGDGAARLLLGGVAALLVFTIPDFARAVLERPIVAGNTSHYGVLVFAASLGLVIEQRYRAQRDGLIASREELERRVHELRALDGELRHQIERRSRDLGEAMASRLVAAGGELHEGDLVDGRYRVVRALGRGAMGTVYEVRRTSDDRPFALKVLTGAASAVSLARFAREAEIAAQVCHENLVAIVDVGVADPGLLYLVMELLPGATLEQARPRFGDVNWGAPLLGQVGSGLAALHERRIVHRDLKPSNVLLTTDSAGRPLAKIADFGLARHEAHARALHTRTGTFVGTPAYMAPEAAAGSDAVGTAADVFAFGILACEVLTGRYPFATPPLLVALADLARPAPQVDPDLPVSPRARALLGEALSWEPAARPPVGELAREIAACGAPG